jgi:predicted aspartyl protease
LLSGGIDVPLDGLAAASLEASTVQVLPVRDGGPLTAILLSAVLLSVGLALTPVHAIAAPDANRCGAVLDKPIALDNVNGLPLVTVLADGALLKLILDTGAERTILTSDAAERVGGKTPQIQFRRSLNGVAGSLPSREVEFNSFTIGGAEIPWRRVMVAKIAMPSLLSTVDGVLGTDVLGRFDIDLDLPKHRMTLYEKGNCTPDWADSHAEIKIGKSAVNSHLFFPVQLDRRKITATIDTGAQRTTLSVATARAMGISDAVLAQDPAIHTRGFGDGTLASRIHQFESLTVGNVRLSNPKIVVTNLRLRGIDLILGMDFLRSRRVWLSYAGFRMFLAGQPGSAASGTRSAYGPQPWIAVQAQPQ